MCADNERFCRNLGRSRVTVGKTTGDWSEWVGGAIRFASRQGSTPCITFGLVDCEGKVPKHRDEPTTYGWGCLCGVLMALMTSPLHQSNSVLGRSLDKLACARKGRDTAA